LVEQSILFGVYVDAQAFSSSLVDVDGVEFASLDFVQHGLAMTALLGPRMSKLRGPTSPGLKIE
jgi:hypothetical protein